MKRLLLTILTVAVGHPGVVQSATATADAHAALVNFLVRTAKESCYAVGDDVPRLAAYAAKNNWSVPPADILKRFRDPSYTLIGGWTFQALGQPFAVQQTDNTADGSRSCSITTKVGSEQDYEAFKARWDESHTVLKHSDRTSPSRLMHFDSLWRPPSSEIASTISFDRNAHTITVLVTAPTARGRHRASPLHEDQPDS